MACGPAQTAVERVFLARLPKVAAFSISGATLTLSDQGNAALLTFRGSTGASALAGSWKVTSYYTGNALASVVGGVDLTAEFGPTTVTGSTGCNTFHGPINVDGDAIQIGPLAATFAACASPALSAQEHSYLAALQLASTFKATGDRLDLFRSGNMFAVTFHRG
jgi:heat shock protein HslJ